MIQIKLIKLRDNNRFQILIKLTMKIKNNNKESSSILQKINN